jgi:hypothetical protein
VSNFNLEEIHKNKRVQKSPLSKRKKSKSTSNKDDDDFMIIAPPHLLKELNEELRREQLWKELYD